MAVNVTSLAIRVESQGISEASRALGGLSTSANNANKRVDTLVEAMKQLNLTSMNAAKASDAFMDKLRQQAAIMANMSASTQASVSGVAQLSIALTNLSGVVVTLNQNLTQHTIRQRQSNNQLAEAHALARGLSGSLGALWVTYGNLAGMGIGIAIGASLKGVISVGKDVQHTLEEIRVLGGATTQEIATMQKTISELGKGAQGPKDVAEALQVLVLAGLNAKEAVSGVGAALNLATAGSVTIEKAASTLVQVSTSLGYTAEGFDHVADVIAKAAAASMSSVDSISGAFKSAAAVGEVYGATLGDIAVGLAAIANLGIQGTAAGTSLKNFYKDLTSGSEKATSAMRSMKLTLADFRDADGFVLPIVDVITKLNEGLSKLKDQGTRETALSQIFGERGIKEAAAMLKLVNTASDEFDELGNKYKNRLEELQADIEKSAGFSTTAAIAMAQTGKNQIASIGNTLQTVFADAFATLQPQIGEIARALKSAFNSKEFKETLQGLISGVTDLTKAVITHIGFIKTLIEAYVAWKAVEMAAGLVKIAQAFQIATVASRAFWVSLGPIGVAIAALTTAWIVYKRVKDYALDNKAASGNLSEYVDNVIKAAEKEQAIIEMRKKGLSEIDIARKQQIQQDKDASDAAVQASQKGLNAMKAQLDTMYSKLSFTERTAIQNDNSMYSNSATTKYKQQLDAYNKSVEQHTQLTRNAKAATDALIAAREENAKFADQQAKEARIKPTGDLDLEGKVDKGALNAKYNAALAEVQGRIDEVKRRLQQSQEDITSSFKQGTIGELAAIRMRQEAEVKAAEDTEKLLQEKLAKAANGKNKDAVEQEVKNARIANNTAVENAARDSANKQAEYWVKLQQDNLQTQADALRKQGLYVEAYTLETQAKYGKLKAQLLSDWEEETDAVKALAIAQRMASLDALQAEGLHDAQIKELTASYNAMALEVGNSIKGIQTATEGQGISTMFDAALKATQTYKDALPGLAEKLDELRQAALGGSDEDKSKYQEALNKQKSLAENVKTMWTGVGKSVSDSLQGAFGKSGKAAGDMLKSLIEFNNTDNKSISAKNKLYGDLAQGAAGFFNEQSKGYKALMTVSQVFHAIELAQLIATNVQRGIAAVLTQGMGDPYTAFARMGAMVALVAGLGVALSGGGGGGGNISKTRQETQGTGSVLGNASDKSDSIQKSLDIIAKDSGLGLVHSAASEKYLKNISDGIGNLASLVARTTGLTANTNANVAEGTKINSSWTTGLGPLASVVQQIPVIGSLVAKLFGSTTTLVDQGIKVASSTLASIQQSGISAQAYATVNTKKSFFGISYSNKTNDQLSGLDPAVTQQFSLLIDNMAKSITAAANTLGIGGDAFTTKLQNFVVDIGKISFKGMSGKEIEETLQSVFSKLGDDMAKFAISGFDKFQKVGEGYLETVTRVANDLIQVRDVFSVLGKSFTLTGTDAIELSENLIATAGGLDKLTEGTKFFVDNFLTESEKLAPVQKSLNDGFASIGISGVTTKDQFKAIVQGLDLTTEAGAKQYAVLMQLAPAFAQVAEAAQKVADKQKDLNMNLLQAKAEAEKDTSGPAHLALLAAQRQAEIDSLKELSPSLVKTQLEIYALQDATNTANKALEAQRNTTSLQIQLLELQGQKETALILSRQLEVADLSETDKEIKYRIYALQDEATALGKTNATASLRARILEAEGNKVEALAITRSIELQGLSETDKALKIRLYQLEDEKNALTQSNATASLYAQTLELQGKSEEALAITRKIELQGLSDIDKAYKEYIFKLQDENTLKQKQNASASLYAQILTLEGKNQEALSITRQIELEKLSDTDKALQQYIYTLTDAQEAYNKSRDLQISLLEALGRKEEALALTRAKAMEGLSAEDKLRQQAIFDAEDRSKAAASSFDVLSKAIEAMKQTNQEAYDATVKSLDSQSEALKNNFDSVKTSLNNSIQAAKDASAAYDELSKAISDSITSMVQDTVLAMSRSDAQKQLDSILNQAAKGKLPTLESMKDILATLSKPNTDKYTSLEEYTKDIGITAGKLNSLKGFADTAKSVQDLQLKALESSLAISESSYELQNKALEDAKKAAKDKLDADNAALDKTLSLAKDQLDTLNNTYVAVQDVKSALDSFNTAVSAAIKAQQTTVAPSLPATAPVYQDPNESAIKNLYSMLLGREADAAGLAYYRQNVALGKLTLSGVAAQIMSSPEYLQHSVEGSHAGGLDDVPHDGYRAKLHKGEMVLPAANAKNVRDGSSIQELNDSMNSKMEDVCEEVAAVQADTRKLLRLFNDIAPDGQTLRVVVTTG